MYLNLFKYIYIYSQFKDVNAGKNYENLYLKSGENIAIKSAQKCKFDIYNYYANSTPKDIIITIIV